MANRNKKTQKKYEKSKKDERFSSKSKRMKDKDQEDINPKDSDSKSWNDASWYIPDEKIRQQVGTYAVNTVTGVPQYLEAVSGELPTTDGRAMVYYGDVMEIRTFPYPGTGTSLTASVNGVSALDTACRKMYTAISSVNSKTTQYTPESLGIAIIALGELVSLISYATRLYGVAFTYNPRNRHVPNKIINAMGISNSILDDLALYRMQLNKLITAANNVRMLKDLKYFTKCWDMYANYYEDSTSGLAQYYVMRPAGYLRYDELTPTTGELTWVDFGASMSYTTLIQHIQTCLNNLLTSSLMNYVYTDIVNYVLKEGGDLLGFSYVGELYSVLPVVDTTFLTQIHNMTWGMFDLSNYKIYEDPNTLEIETSDIYDKHGSDVYWRMASACDRIIDFPFSDNPSVDEKIDAVAFTTIVWDIDDTTSVPNDMAVPDHPVHSVYIHRNDGSPILIPHLADLTSVAASTLFTLMNLTNTFSVAPLWYCYTYTTSGTLTLGDYVLGSLNYFTVMQYKQLKNIFDFSFLGLFDAEVKSVKPY